MSQNDMFLSHSGVGVGVGNYDEFVNPKFATMVEVGRKQKAKPESVAKAFSTMNHQHHHHQKSSSTVGTKQVRLQVDAEAVPPTMTSTTTTMEREVKQSRNRSTQVPTPTEDDSFFPGEYLREKEKDKFAKSVWE